MKNSTFMAIAMATLLSIAATAQTVEEIVSKHVTALGGKDKLNGVKTLYTERLLSVQGMDIPNKTTMVVGKALRTESSVMGNSMIQVIDGSTGWMIRPAMMGGSGNPEDMPAEMVKQQLGQLDPFGPLVNYQEKGNKVELVGKEKVEGKDSYHLKITTKEGLVMEEYLDSNTYLLNKLKVNMNGQQGEMIFSDYKEVEGIPFANTTQMTSEQAGNLVFTTNKVTINGPVDEGIFKKPTN